jgi:hypothetical protein
MNQFRIIYIWKYHNETPCIAILNKQKCLFFPKTEGRKLKQFWSEGSVAVGGGGRKERVYEGECGGNIVYSCRKGKNETC